MVMEFIQIVVSLVSLTALELVLSIDNILFIGLVTETLAGQQRRLIQQVGVILAVSGRIILLLCINWLVHINYPLLTIHGFQVSIRDILMTAGGVYLILFATNKLREIWNNKPKSVTHKTATSVWKILILIILGDTLFSFDSVLAAIIIGHNTTVMIIAIILASITLMLSVSVISRFIEKHPNIKILSLCFLLLAGISLGASGFHYEISSLQMFVMMLFAAFVQLITMRYYTLRSR